VARNEPGTQSGGGETIGYSFFSKTPNLKLVFRKRAFKAGSGVWLLFRGGPLPRDADHEATKRR
jgi:hypothetical protein